MRILHTSDWHLGQQLYGFENGMYLKTLEKIQPGCAVVFYDDERTRQEVKLRIAHETAKLRRSCEILDIQIRWERTEDERLVNRIIARRVNVGCVDSYAVIVGDCNNIRPFLERYFDLADATSAEVLIVGAQEDAASDDVEFSTCVCEEEAKYLSREEAEIGRIENETQIFLNEVSRLIRDYVSKTHQMPPMAEIEKIVSGNLSIEKGHLSELVVDRGFRIILPSYDNLELPLQPLSKALYFLFLLNPEGIRLAEIANYQKELEDIYGIIIPNRDEVLARQSIEMLTDPLNTDSLRQQISRIKRVVKAKILTPTIAEQYYISGERGEEYRIPLSRDLVHLPKILTM